MGKVKTPGNGARQENEAFPVKIKQETDNKNPNPD